MKKLLFVLALGAFAACNSGSDADNAKDSTVDAIDSSASASKDSVNAMADSTKDMIDSSAAAAKDSVKH
jgi:hypothetical protein